MMKKVVGDLEEGEGLGRVKRKWVVGELGLAWRTGWGWGWKAPLEGKRRFRSDRLFALASGLHGEREREREEGIAIA